MKSIYLRNDQRNWQRYEYETREALVALLTPRGIRLGDGASIGQHASIGHRASIGDDAKVPGPDGVDPVAPVIPVVPQLATKILAAIEHDGALEMGSWHTCETTHCRAGWAIHLAGLQGYALEKFFGPWMAGHLITRASCPYRTLTPDFYASNHDALADIRADAAKEAAVRA